MNHTVTDTSLPEREAGPPFLSRERIIARPGFNRWLVPPAALAIHLCIGMAYGFSVFWLPLSQAIGLSAAQACGPEVGFWGELFTTTCDWRVSTLGWMYTLFFVLLGSSAAIWGNWLERAGPRKAGVVSALCWCGGMLISALGIHLHQFWLMLLGSGVIGGIGLGLGYISPVSTLIKWFPDRRGMATGMAIMGFGGGAMIGSPLAAELMAHFRTPDDVGVAQTFVTMALIYFVFMIGGALGYRVPPANWKPAGWTPPPSGPSAPTDKAMITAHHVHVREAWRTPQFWLVWTVLLMNVSAGIGMIGMASPMLQEVFGGQLIGVPERFSELGGAGLTAIAAVAAGFTALLSLFNIGGRFCWASLSDRLGRKQTYMVFFVIGGLLYASIPSFAAQGSQLLFVAAFCVIVSMYGGGFSTLPAYLADLFGTQMVGAIHGRLLSAWATAGVLGPVVVNYMRDYQLARGLPREQVYNQTMYILVGMLAVGFVCNLLVRPVNPKHFMSEADLAAEKRQEHDLPDGRGTSGRGTSGRGTAAARPTRSAAGPVATDDSVPAASGTAILLPLAWLAVGLPLAWGIYRTAASVALMAR